MQHVSLKKVVRGLRASIEGKFGLAAVQVCFPPRLWKSKSLTHLAQGRHGQHAQNMHQNSYDS